MPSYESRSSITKLLFSELLDMAAALGGLKEAQRAAERHHDSLTLRVSTLEAALLQSKTLHEPATPTPMWKQLLQVLLPHETVTRLLLSLVPRLLFIGAILGKWVEKAWAYLSHAFS